MSCDLDKMLETIHVSVNSTHLLLKYVVEAYKEGKDLEYALPALEMHIHSLDNLAGPATVEAARKIVEDGLAHIAALVEEGAH
jgi:hypothetical protein